MNMVNWSWWTTDKKYGYVLVKQSEAEEKLADKDREIANKVEKNALLIREIESLKASFGRLDWCGMCKLTACGDFCPHWPTSPFNTNKTDTTHVHEFVSARNEVIKSGLFCKICGAVAPEPPTVKPKKRKSRKTGMEIPRE
jgi:hypothetical protein